ncbi:4-hydroxy-tetrahydrodipicolinate reductase [Synergistaceae bacterium OttesenSCG-928-I11]|nr:4-hydroxy-tetrahydrodipicolinate reductase [Synergistaceae bacterium OttesenSCG-928-I11]
MIRVFLSGASGNVGKAIVRAIAARDDIQLVGGWCLDVGKDLGILAGIEPLEVTASSNLDEGLAETRPDIVIDFTSANLLQKNFTSYLHANLNAVIGTTGLTEADEAACRARVEEKGLRWAVIATYSIGMNMIADFVRKMRAYYPYVSVLDQFTDEMANAPSGTACWLAEVIGGDVCKAKTREVYPGAMGATVNDVRLLSRRLPWPGAFAEHEILMSCGDETVKITVEGYSSEIYTNGVLMTAEKLAAMPAGTFITNLMKIIEA